MAAVLVHIDLDGDRPHASSLQALAAGRTVASSWGATLYAAVLVHDPSQRPSEGEPARPAVARVPGDPRTIEAVRSALARGGADKIVVALSAAPAVPLWCAVGEAWQGVLDRLRPRLVLFGADAPAAIELGPRTGARIGARMLLRARAADGDEVELRDRDGACVRASDGGAAVAHIGEAARLPPHGDDDIDVLVLAMPGCGDPRVERLAAARSSPRLARDRAAVIALGDGAARDPDVVAAARQLARLLGAEIIGGAAARAAGVVADDAVVDGGAALAPELCVAIGGPALDVAGAASVIRIGDAGGAPVDGELVGAPAALASDLARALEER